MAIDRIDRPPKPNLEAQVGAYAERLFGDWPRRSEAITISLGRGLGLYDHLTDDGGVTAAELARPPASTPLRARNGSNSRPRPDRSTSPRRAIDADQRRFGLSIAAQECLLHPDSLASVGPLFDLLPRSIASIRRRIVNAYRTGRDPVRRLRAPRCRKATSIGPHT